MKTTMKKVFVTLLVPFMLLVGCSSSTSSSTASSGGSTTEPVSTEGKIPTSEVYKGETNQQTYPISAEKLTISYWYPNAGSIGNLADFNDSEYFQWMEEKTNIHVDFIVPAVGSEAENFNLLFASDNLPDVMYTIPSSYKYKDGMDAAIEDGYILDLSQYLDKVPNYVSWINSIEGADKDVFTDTGKMYGFWGFWDNMETGYADQGLAIRQDWLDKVGMSVPTTYAEWETVLTAFKDQLGIEIPFYTSKYGIDYGEFMAGYGVAPYFYQVDGTVKYGPLEDGYLEYLTMMNDWYNKGLLDQDFSTRQSTGVSADKDVMYNDKVGALIDWGTRMTDAYISKGAANPDYWLTACPQPKKNASDADPTWRAAGNNWHSLSGVCVCINANTEHLDEVLAWVDSFYAQDIYLNANYGIDSEEGTVWYAAEDGHRIGNYDFRYKNPDGLDSGTVAAKYWAKNPPIRVEAAQIEQMPAERAASYSVWSKYLPTSYLPTTMTMTADEGNEYASIYSEIETYVQENNVKFINGERSLSEYSDYVATLKSMGIDQCIAIQQAALDRYNAR